ILFSDSLAAGETGLYQITVTGGTTSGNPTPTPTPTPTGTVLPTNGSFESGSGSPPGWTPGTSATDGGWSWDATTASRGTRSAKLVVAGTAKKISPALRSSNFSLSAGHTYVLSASMKTSGAGGDHPPTVYVVELDSAGNVLYESDGSAIQHAVPGAMGTTGWASGSETFVTNSRCAKAYVYANLYKGHSTL